MVGDVLTTDFNDPECREKYLEYDLMVVPGGVKALEKIKTKCVQNKQQQSLHFCLPRICFSDKIAETWSQLWPDPEIQVWKGPGCPGNLWPEASCPKNGAKRLENSVR